MSEKLKSRMSKASLYRKMTVGSDDLAVFTFLPHDDLFSFDAGQFAHLALDIDGEFIQRPFTIASSSYEREHLEFYILRADGGTFTPRLFEMKRDDEIYYMGPGGKFTLDRSEKSHLLMISTGTGLAPFVSMVRKLHTDFIRGAAAFDAITLMQGVSYARDLGYHKEMIGYSGEEKFGFRYLPAISRPDEDADFNSSLSRGRVNDVVRHLFDEEKSGHVDPILGEGVTASEILEKIPPEETTIYVCGHPGMIEDVKQVTERHGFTDILKEDYW